MALSQTLGGSNPKNYQIWYHRRVLLQDLYPKHSLKKDFLHSELGYITSVLDEDSKNYHAWSHRQWLIATINDNDVWEKEMEFGTFYLTFLFLSSLHPFPTRPASTGTYRIVSYRIVSYRHGIPAY